jgi:hypothetical protein
LTALTLAQPDIGLYLDFEATRIVIPHLQVAVPSELWDETAVMFDGDTDPTAYRGDNRTAAVECRARSTHTEHANITALLELFRSARVAADARLLLRVNHGVVAGFDELLVGTVPAWSRVNVTGQAWDVGFTFNRRQFDLAE